VIVLVLAEYDFVHGKTPVLIIGNTNQR